MKLPPQEKGARIIDIVVLLLKILLAILESF